MNKKLTVLAFLPMFLLGGCGVERAIDKEQAKEVATSISEKQYSIHDIDELTILISNTYSQSAPSSSGGVSLQKKTVGVIQLSKTHNYYHVKTTGKDSVFENWTFVKDDLIYYLNRFSLNGINKAMGVVSAYNPSPDFSIISDETLTNILVLRLQAFNAKISDLVNSNEEEEVKGETSSTSYYSSSQNNLHINITSEAKDAEYRNDTIEGIATGSEKTDYFWKDSNPVRYVSTAEYNVKEVGELQTINYQVKSESSLIAQYSGTLIEYPILSNFDITVN